jgi:prolyl-tRNA synthetase
MGALIMAHSDDEGLVLPPLLAPIQVVIIPIYKTQEQLETISNIVKKCKKEWSSNGISVKFDDRDTQSPGWKFAEYELKGVPIRIAIGPKDIENETVEIARRDTKEKFFVKQIDLTQKVVCLLEEIQQNIYNKALNRKKELTTKVDSWEEFQNVLKNKGGFISAHWDGTSETEEKIKELTKATIRCIPLNQLKEEGLCIFTGKKSEQRVLFALNY